MVGDRVVTVVAICGIVVLEALNILVLKQNGVILAGVMATIAGIAGYGGFKAGKRAKQEEATKDSI